MKYLILPNDPNDECLEVHITLRQSYSAVKDAFDRAFQSAFRGSLKIVATKDEEGGRHFEIHQEGGYFSAVVKFFLHDGETEVVVENRRPSDGYWGRAWKGAVVAVTRAFCEHLSRREYVTPAETAKLLMELEPHGKN